LVKVSGSKRAILGIDSSFPDRTGGF